MNDFIDLHRLLGLLAGPGQGQRFDQVVTVSPMLLGVPVIDGNTLLDTNAMTISDLLTEAARSQWADLLEQIADGGTPSGRTAADTDRRRILATAGRGVRGTGADLIAALVGDAAEGIWLLAACSNPDGTIDSLARFEVTARTANLTSGETLGRVAEAARTLHASMG